MSKNEAYQLEYKRTKLPPEFDDSRKLIIEVPEEKFRFILAKPMDVPTYVEHGVADLGIAGKDVMLEEERDVYQEGWKCRMIYWWPRKESPCRF